MPFEKRFFKALDESQIQKLCDYKTEILKMNQTLNLISKASEKNIDTCHFYDCVEAVKISLESFKKDEVYDLGSGGGFPGLVMAIMAPEKHMVLVERDQRKAEGLKILSFRLHLSNVEVLSQPLESIEAPVFQAITRAMGSLQEVLEKLSPQKGTQVCHLKVQDSADLKKPLSSSWRLTKVTPYQWPGGKKHFCVAETTAF